MFSRGTSTFLSERQICDKSNELPRFSHACRRASSNTETTRCRHDRVTDFSGRRRRFLHSPAKAALIKPWEDPKWQPRQCDESARGRSEEGNTHLPRGRDLHGIMNSNPRSHTLDSLTRHITSTFPCVSKPGTPTKTCWILIVAQFVETASCWSGYVGIVTLFSWQQLDTGKYDVQIVNFSHRILRIDYNELADLVRYIWRSLDRCIKITMKSDKVARISITLFSI